MENDNPLGHTKDKIHVVVNNQDRYRGSQILDEFDNLRTLIRVRPELGSSSIRSFGFEARLRAISSLRCSP